MSRHHVSAIAVVVLGVLLLGLEIFAIGRVWRGVGEIFPGFIVSRELVVTQLNQPYWPGIRAGLRPGDVVVALDGQPVAHVGELLARIRSQPPQAPLRYRVVRAGSVLELTIPSAIFSAIDFASTFGVLALTGTTFLLLGSLVLWLRPDALGSGVYALSAAAAFATAIAPDLAWGQALSLGRIRTVLLAAGALHFAMVFPEPRSWLRSRPWLLGVPWIIAFPLMIVDPGPTGGDPVAAGRDEWVNRWASVLVAASFLSVILSTGSVRVRERVRTTRWGLGLAVACYASGFLGAEFGWIPSAPASVFVLPAWLWFATLAVASLRDDVFDFGSRVRESIVPAARVAMTVVLHLGLFAMVLVAFRVVGVGAGWLPALTFLALASLVAERLRTVADEMVARIGDAPAVLGPKRLRRVIAELAASLEEHAIVDRVLRLQEELGTYRLQLFLVEDGELREAQGSLRFPREHPLFTGMCDRETPCSSHDRAPSGGTGLAVRESLRTLGLSLLLPLRFRGEWLGLLGVASRARNGGMAEQDVSAFPTLAAQLAVALANARAFRRIVDLEAELRADNVVLREELAAQTGPEGLVGQGSRMRDLYRAIDRIAPTDAIVLLRGETGTGKELIARAIHARSRRRHRPMIRVNCAAIHPSLLESEFFGHERGAFTGAVARRIGRFELAAGGSIFLDEVGELPLSLQAKLLRVLQDREFERVGGTATLFANVRILAATNRDLEGLVRQGRFREDLFHRLNVVPIFVPPLREHREDIPALVAHLVARYARRTKKRVTSIDERSLRALMTYDWPGNVRELENLVERAVILANGERLVVRELDLPGSDVGRTLRPLSEILREVKVRTIRGALTRTSGNQAQAAELLRLKPSSLSRMMKQLGLRA